jgi:hypothetical protein
VAVATCLTARCPFALLPTTPSDLDWLDEVGLTLPAGWTAVCNSQEASDSGGNAVNFDCAANANSAANSATYSDDDGDWG